MKTLYSKKMYLLLMIFCLPILSISQQIDVDGKIKIGNEASPSQEGEIRWNGTDFEGYKNGNWVSMTGQFEYQIGCKDTLYLGDSFVNIPGISDANPDAPLNECNCNDGIDNDNDGNADCDDSDCINSGFCLFNCDNAIELVPGITYQAPPITEGGQALQFDATHSIWYKFTLAGPGFVTISSCKSNILSRAYLYTNCTDVNTIISTNVTYDECDQGWKILNAQLFAGTYYVEWDDSRGNEAFEFSFSKAECGNGIMDPGEECDDGNNDEGDGCNCACQTVAFETNCGDGIDNDGDGDIDCEDIDCQLNGFCNTICANAESITPGSYTSIPILTGNGATGGVHDAVWYTFTIASPAVLNVASCLSNHDTRVRIHSGSCGSLTEVGFNDDGCTGATSKISNLAIVAGIYFIEWDNLYSSLPVDFIFTLSTCGDGTLDFGEECDDGNLDDGDGCNCSCQTETTESLCDDGIDNDGDGLTDCDDPDCDNTTNCAEICDDGIDNDGDGLIDCNDPDCDDTNICGESTCNDGIDNDGDGYADCADVDCNCSGNALATNCFNARPIGTGTIHSIAPISGNGSYRNGSPFSHSVWYSFTPSVAASVTISSCGSGADTFLYLYSGDCQNLVLVNSNDDDCPLYNGPMGGSNFASSLTESILAGTTYYIEWSDQYFTSKRDFDFTITIN